MHPVARSSVRRRREPGDAETVLEVMKGTTLVKPACTRKMILRKPGFVENQQNQTKPTRLVTWNHLNIGDSDLYIKAVECI